MLRQWGAKVDWDKIKREFRNFIEWKGKEGRTRRVTGWDIFFTAIMLLTIFILLFAMYMMGIIQER